MIILSLLLIMLFGCTNPFAPTLDFDLSDDESLISDQTTVEGLFQNFQYAYTFMDTTIYGQLLASDFVFTYRDYDLGVDYSWGRDEEMQVTYGLFQNAQSLDLIWNEIVSISSDSSNVIRSFNLTITFNPSDIESVDGNVNLNLRKNDDDQWQITQWIDESDY